MPCWMWMSSCRFQGVGYLHGGFVNPSNMLLLLHSLPLNPAFSMGLDHYNCLWCLRKLSWNNWNVFLRFRMDLSCYPPRLFRDISYYCSSTRLALWLGLCFAPTTEINRLFTKSNCDLHLTRWKLSFEPRITKGYNL